MFNHTLKSYKKNTKFLSILGPIEQILDEVTTQDFKKGETIFYEGTKADTIFFVESGLVKVEYHTDSGKVIAKNLNGEGDIFGELALAKMPIRQNTAKAVTDIKVKEIRKQDIVNLMEKFPNFNFYIIQRMGDRILEMEKKIESLVLDSSRNRIINFLLFMSKKYGKRIGFEHVVWTTFTHQEISMFTSTSRQTVTTTFSELRKKNLIVINKRRLLIRDLKKLEMELS